jgi:hypothetical protein
VADAKGGAVWTPRHRSSHQNDAALTVLTRPLPLRSPPVRGVSIVALQRAAVCRGSLVSSAPIV